MNNINLTFHHIGIAIADIKAGIALYQQLGYQASEIVRDAVQQVDLVLMTPYINDKNYNYLIMNELNKGVIELVSPYQQGSPVERILQKNGTMPYHICYEVEDIDKQISELRKLGFVQICKKVQAIAFNNREICFLYHKHFGTLELLQK